MITHAAFARAVGILLSTRRDPAFSSLQKVSWLSFRCRLGERLSAVHLISDVHARLCPISKCV